MGYYRNPRTANERRQYEATCVWRFERPPFRVVIRVRERRKPNRLWSCWDDFIPGTGRCWKRTRATQWRPQRHTCARLTRRLEHYERLWARRRDDLDRAWWVWEALHTPAFDLRDAARAVALFGPAARTRVDGAIALAQALREACPTSPPVLPDAMLSALEHARAQLSADDPARCDLVWALTPHSAR